MTNTIPNAINTFDGPYVIRACVKDRPDASYCILYINNI